jgi:hypothetical protein
VVTVIPVARAGEMMERPEQVRDADRPSSDLIKELKQRYRQLGSIPKEYESALDTEGDVGGIGSSSETAGPQETDETDEATGRARVEIRIHHLEAILKERGHL